MAKPKVVIVTRTKDRLLFLNRALKSVSAQTFKDYIHVIVNDGGGKDQIKDLVRSLPDEFSKKVKIYNRNKPSNGPDTIFNESIDRVDSEYFVIHDDDDSWHSEFLEKTVSELDNKPELGAVVARADKVTEDIVDGSIRFIKTKDYLPEMRTISLFRQCVDNQLTPIATLHRRSSYEMVGKFDSSLPIVGDWEFGIRLLQKYDVGFIDPGYPLAYYHHRKTNKDNYSVRFDHREYITKVANKYLRQDLEAGQLGVGYIINDLRFSRDLSSEGIKKYMPKSVLNFVKSRKN